MKFLLKLLLTLSLLALAGLAVLVLIAIFTPPMCYDSDTYDDELTGLIYEDGGVTDPTELKEIRFFAVPGSIGAPCPQQRHLLRLLHTATSTEELGMWLAAIKERNWVRCPEDHGASLGMPLGMEFVMRDGRMTFYEIWAYEKDVTVFPLEEKRHDYNSWGTCTSTMFPLLERTGILRRLIDYNSGKKQ